MDTIRRINITIDEDLLNKIDSYSKKRYVTRSGLISFVLSMYLDSIAFIDDDPNLFSDDLKSTTGFEEV